MHAPGQVERVWVRRLRWRMRGAWQWPAFGVLTLVDALLLTRLPFYDEGPGTFVAGALVATFFNLIAVAVVGPLLAVRLRRRRPDLPRVIAADYASTAVLVLICAGLLAGGLLHRPASRPSAPTSPRWRRARTTTCCGTHRSTATGCPRSTRCASRTTSTARASPAPDPRRWLCLFVTTDQRPPGVTEDPDRAPQRAYRSHGGFR